MKLHVKFEAGSIKVDEVVSGADADEVVAAMQQRVAREAGFVVGMAVRAMTPLGFAREATRRYNEASGDDLPLPQDCAEFVEAGIRKGFATRLED